jgi:hypothetical protein
MVAIAMKRQRISDFLLKKLLVKIPVIDKMQLLIQQNQTIKKVAAPFLVINFIHR